MVELLVSLDGIRENTAVIARLLARHGLTLTAVTKACLGEPAVARAMLDGGASALADTRDLSLRRLRAAFPAAEVQRLYLPPPSGPFEPGDLTYISSTETAQALARSAAAGEPRRAMIQVETGDRREGVPGALLDALAGAVAGDPRLTLAGVGTNYACFLGGPKGIRRSVAALAAAATRLRRGSMRVERVSGGNSSTLPLLLADERLPPEITELRCGESLLLGREALFGGALPGCRQDAVQLRAQVLERYTKPRRPGAKDRLVLGVGWQDVGRGGLESCMPGLLEVGRSSNYLVLEAREESPSPGDAIDFIPSYAALVAAWTSPFAEVRFV